MAGVSTRHHFLATPPEEAHAGAPLAEAETGQVVRCDMSPQRVCQLLRHKAPAAAVAASAGEPLASEVQGRGSAGRPGSTADAPPSLPLILPPSPVGRGAKSVQTVHCHGRYFLCPPSTLAAASSAVSGAAERRVAREVQADSALVEKVRVGRRQVSFAALQLLQGGRGGEGGTGGKA